MWLVRQNVASVGLVRFVSILVRTINKFPVNFESINLSLVSTISKLAIKMLLLIFMQHGDMLVRL